MWWVWGEGHATDPKINWNFPPALPWRLKTWENEPLRVFKSVFTFKWILRPFSHWIRCALHPIQAKWTSRCVASRNAFVNCSWRILCEAGAWRGNSVVVNRAVAREALTWLTALRPSSLSSLRRFQQIAWFTHILRILQTSWWNVSPSETDWAFLVRTCLLPASSPEFGSFGQFCLSGLCSRFHFWVIWGAWADLWAFGKSERNRS